MRLGDLICRTCGNPYPAGANYCLYCGTPLFQRQPISPKIRYFVLNRDDHTCQYCGRTPQDGIKLHIDHRIPVAGGGTNEPDNLVTACEECNLGKGKTLPGHNPYKALKDERTHADRIQSELAAIESEYNRFRDTIALEIDTKFRFCRDALRNAHWAWERFAGFGLRNLRDTSKIFAADLKYAADAVRRNNHRHISDRYKLNVYAFIVGVVLDEVLVGLAREYAYLLRKSMPEDMNEASFQAFHRLLSEVEESTIHVPGLLELDDIDFYGGVVPLEKILDSEIGESIRRWLETFDGQERRDISQRVSAAHELIRLKNDVEQGKFDLGLEKGSDGVNYRIDLPDYFRDEVTRAMESVLYWTNDLGYADSFFLGLADLDKHKTRSPSGRDAVEYLTRVLVYDESRLRINWRG